MYRAYTSTKATTTRVRVIRMKALITYANTKATIIAEVRPRRPVRVIPEDGHTPKFVSGPPTQHPRDM